MSQQPSELLELDLVGKVKLRIAIVETPIKLESTLQTYLPPLLLKLASPYLTVRNKVISVCQHINARIKSPYARLLSRTLPLHFLCSFGFILSRHFGDKDRLNSQ